MVNHLRYVFVVAVVAALGLIPSFCEIRIQLARFNQDY
jgi:hypothetical protein